MDQTPFLSALFRSGHGLNGAVLKPDTLRQTFGRLQLGRRRWNLLRGGIQKKN